MRNLTLLSILVILSIFFSATIWEFIKLDGGNIQILGEYNDSKHHALNDPLRYLIFVFVPVLTFILYNFLIKKSSLSLSSLKLEIYNNEKEINILFSINLIIIFLLFLEFLSINFPLDLIDIFHEGQKLSAPYKSLLDGKLWTGSYVTTGIINENLGIKLFWNIIDNENIGSMRYVQLLYIFFLKLSLAVLIYQISKYVLFLPKFRIFFYLVLIFISLYLIDYDLGYGDNISYRDLPVVLSLNFFIKSFSNKNNKFPIIFIGFLAVTSYFWSIDRALIVNFLTFFICFILFINQKFKEIIIILGSIIIFWFFFFMILGDEFFSFLENTYSILKNQNYIQGIIHPKPFSDMENSSRATRSLLLIILSLIVSINFLFYKKKKYHNNLIIIIFTLSFLAFCSYLYALSRSDGGHIKQTTGFLILIFSIIIFFNLSSYLNNLKILNFSKNFLFSILFLPLTILIIYNLQISFKNIVNYVDRFNEYIALEDNVFLSDKQNYFVEKAKPLVGNYDCVQLFTYDAALPYLLKKPNCTKYYFLYSLGSAYEQKDLIKNMNNTDLVIYIGQTDNWGLSPQKKLTIVDNYIKSEFLKSKKISDWEIKFR